MPHANADAGVAPAASATAGDPEPAGRALAWARWMPALVVVAYLMFLIPWVKTTPGNVDRARLAEIEAIVERGTFAIEGSTYDHTTDKIFLRGHFYSNKPPMLSVLGALVYAPEHWVLHWSFHKRPELIVYSVAFAIVGGAGALLMMVFYHSLSLWLMPEWQRLTLTGALGLATLLFPYTTVLNSHVVAASLSFGAFWLLFRARVYGMTTQGRVLASGFLAALAASIDLVPGSAFLGLLTIYVVAWPSLRTRWLAFAAGALVPIAGFVALNVAITGGVSVPYNNPAYYQYPGTPWHDPVAIVGSPQVVSLSPSVLASRLGFILLSNVGFFSFMPILYVPLLAMGETLLRRHRFWPEALLVWAAVLGLVAIHAVITKGSSGDNFGYRYLIPLIPFVLFFAPAAFKAGQSLWSAFFVISAIYSMGMAFAGAAGNPWRDIDFSQERTYAYFAINYLLLAIFVGLCGMMTIRALGARAAARVAGGADRRSTP